MIKNLCTLIFIGLLFSCNSKDLVYVIPIYKSDGIAFIAEANLKGNYKNMLENGEWNYIDKDKNLIQSGQFKTGLKFGMWEYNVVGSNKEKIYWKIYEGENILINIPSEWRNIESDYLFYSVKDSVDSNVYDEYFVILEIPTSKDMTIDEYVSLYNSFISNERNLVSKKRYVLTLGNQKNYLSNYIIIQDEQEYLVLNLITKSSNELIYDITLITLNKETIRNNIIFQDMARSIQINGERIYSPIVPSFEIYELN